jgi:transcriptional regulator with XRE-family HTH domain
VAAANLQRLRHEKGLAQDDLAHEAKVRRTYLSQLEKGTFYASLKIIEKLAKALGVEAYDRAPTKEASTIGVSKRPSGGSKNCQRAQLFDLIISRPPHPISIHGKLLRIAKFRAAGKITRSACGRTLFQ